MTLFVDTRRDPNGVVRETCSNIFNNVSPAAHDTPHQRCDQGRDPCFCLCWTCYVNCRVRGISVSSTVFDCWPSNGLRNHNTQMAVLQSTKVAEIMCKIVTNVLDKQFSSPQKPCLERHSLGKCPGTHRWLSVFPPLLLGCLPPQDELMSKTRDWSQ